MAKTRKKIVRTPLKGRKSTTIEKKSPIIAHRRGAKSRIPKSKSKHIKTMLYESPLKHLHYNGEQSNAQSQFEDTEVNKYENLPEYDESKVDMNPNSEAECENVVNNNEKKINCSTNLSLKTKSYVNSTSVESDIAPVKQRKLNKSPLSRLRDIDQPASTKLLDKIDESIICVDDLDTDSTNSDSTKPQVNSQDIVVIDCNETLGSTETCIRDDNQDAKHNLTDSVIVLDDEPGVSSNKTKMKPAEDCMVVWSSLPASTLPPMSVATSSQNIATQDIFKWDKISLDTSGELSNLKHLRNDNSNKKLAKKSPKVTKFGVKKLNNKKVSEITKGLAKTKTVLKTVPKVTKTPMKKKNKGDLIFSAKQSDSKSNDKQTKNESKPKKGTLREIVIDGSNVAMACTNNKMFSEKGIKMLIDYFSKKGHSVKVFVPQYRRARHYPLLEKWHDEGIVVFTPSRKVGNKCITSYDDRFIIEYATTCKGIVVSQDQFRDLYAEKAEYKDTIENRLLVPTFVGDYVMFPEDPLGRNGPSLSTFLKH